MRRNRWFTAVAMSAAVLVVGAGIALADDISNNLDTSIDAVVENVNLTVGGPDGTVGLFLQPRNGDGDNGCNLEGTAQSATFSVTSSNTSAATVSPSSVTFNNCGDTPSLTVHAVAAGSSTVSLAETANSSGGTFNVAPATFTVTVTGAPANTAPSVAVTGFTDGASFEIGSEPTPGCSVSDAEDTGESASPVVDSSALVHGMGTVTVTCSYTDGGGLSDSDSKSYTLVDTTDPTIQAAISPTAPDGSNGWYVTAPTVSFTCADSPGSGIQSCVADGEPTNSKGPLGDGADQSVSGTATDWANNTATASISNIDVDTTDPTSIAFVGGPASGGSYYFGSVPAAPTCTASDATSGLASCNVTGYATTVGSHTMTATATDNAGNSNTAQSSYTVLPWTLRGFYSPVDMNEVVNIVKAGSTVPLKFELFAGPTELTSTSAIDTFKVGSVPCTTFVGDPIDDIELYSTGGTAFRYDTTGGQFIQNWKTPSTKGACYKVVMTADDASSLTAFFRTK